MLLQGGAYTYTSTSLDADIDGNMLSAAAMPGWRFSRDHLTVTVYAGPVVQDYRLMPDDPGSRLRGFYLGGEFAADVWYQPSERTMVTLNGMIASIGPTGSLRTAFGFKLFEPIFIGPETQAIWCANFNEVQFGGQLTGWHLNAFEWTVGGGWSMTSDHRAGPYFHLGVNTRY